jgi:hypothetical protein
VVQTPSPPKELGIAQTDKVSPADINKDSGLPLHSVQVAVASTLDVKSY